MKVISTKIDAIDTLKTAKGYLGKKVVSKSGARLGRISDIIFLKDGLQGIVVRNIFIDKEFFGIFGDALMLTIDPVTHVLNKQVFDADGRKMGKVKDIVSKGNDLKSILIKKGVFSKDLRVEAKEIAVMKDNIILKKSYEE